MVTGKQRILTGKAKNSWHGFIMTGKIIYKSNVVCMQMMVKFSYLFVGGDSQKKLTGKSLSSA